MNNLQVATLREFHSTQIVNHLQSLMTSSFYGSYVLWEWLTFWWLMTSLWRKSSMLYCAFIDVAVASAAFFQTNSRTPFASMNFSYLNTLKEFHYVFSRLVCLLNALGIKRTSRKWKFFHKTHKQTFPSPVWRLKVKEKMIFHLW